VTGELYTLRFAINTDCYRSTRKQNERASKIATLPQVYLSPLSAEDRSILGKPIQELVQEVHNNITKPVDILRAYGKVTVKAQEKTNCATEILFPEAEEWAEKEVNLRGPLAGIPVSLKDSIVVKGFDTSVGYSCNTGKPYLEDGIMVKILKDAGMYRSSFAWYFSDLSRCRAFCENTIANHSSVLRVY
jgi:hypothetical protein